MPNNDPNYKPKVEPKILLEYIPHGIDYQVFKKIDVENQGETITKKNKDGVEYTETEFEEMVNFRQQLFSEKDYKFIVFFNNRNIRRKMTGDIILAFKTFVDSLPEEEKDDVILIMHTAVVDNNGTDLLAVKTAMAPDVNIMFSTQRLDPTHMNYLYNIVDVTINIASNEGYGLSTAESLMTETPIIVNVTGGLQDQCGFVNKSNNFLDPDKHYKKEWGSNHDGKYKKHGLWVKPIFPNNRSLMGSPPTPYIFDDRCTWEEASEAIKYWYDLGDEKRKEYGKLGRQFMFDTGMTAQKLGERFIDYIDKSIEKFKPKKRFNVYKL